MTEGTIWGVIHDLNRMLDAGNMPEKGRFIVVSQSVAKAVYGNIGILLPDWNANILGSLRGQSVYCDPKLQRDQVKIGQNDKSPDPHQPFLAAWDPENGPCWTFKCNPPDFDPCPLGIII